MIGKKTSRTLKSPKVPRPSFITLASALKKMTPSRPSLQILLSSATFMNPTELPLTASSVSSPLGKTDGAIQRTIISQSSVEQQRHPPRPIVEAGGSDTDENHDTEGTPRSAVSSQRHLTFPPSNVAEYRLQSSSLELPRTESHWATQNISDIGQGTIVNDGTRSGLQNLLRSFRDDPVHIHGSQMIHRHDIAHMIELHVLACREDRFVRRLQRNQIPRAEIQTMRIMLGDRVTSAIDNVLVARISNSHDPMDIVGWLSCSIIRCRSKSKAFAEENDVRALDWNLATAVRLNMAHNAGSPTQLFGDDRSLEERNRLIEVVSRGNRWSQRTEFPDEDFIAITNLALHPNYPTGRDIGTQLILEARKQAYQLGMSLYVLSSGPYCAELYKEQAGFSELGDHRSLMFEPEYRWKYLVFRPSRQRVEFEREEMGLKPFDFGWRALKGM